MRPTYFIFATAALWLTAGTAMAQSKSKAATSAAPRAEAAPRAAGSTLSSDDADHFHWDDDGDRAWLGISTGSGGKRDTLGLLIESVVPGSPAEKAGLEEGNRIAAINGVNLKLDAADAGEPEMSGMAQRRLTRELRKAKPGDEIELRVWSSGQYRNVKVKTGTPDEPEHVTLSSLRDRLKNRVVLGVGLGSTGSKRDTLGVFVSSVSEGGPADKAGVVEGDRIGAIDGIDLRVPREDAGDGMVGSARMNRLQRTLRDKKPGDEVSLHLWSGGRWRDVKVKVARAADLPGDHNEFRFFTGDEPGGILFRTPMPAMAPFAPAMPMLPSWPRVLIDGEPLALQLGGQRMEIERAQRALEGARLQLRQALPGTPRVTIGRRTWTI